MIKDNLIKVTKTLEEYRNMSSVRKKLKVGNLAMQFHLQFNAVNVKSLQSLIRDPLE